MDFNEEDIFKHMHLHQTTDRTCEPNRPSFAPTPVRPRHSSRTRPLEQSLQDLTPNLFASGPKESSRIRTQLPVNHSVPISHYMPMHEIIASLGNHGCQDITNQLDLTSGGDYPVSNGGFGDVYKLKLGDGLQVAVKTMRLYADYMSSGGKYFKDAARELHTWSKCDHPNVAKLLGFVIFRDQIGMVSEWMDHGSLPGYIQLMEATRPQTEVQDQSQLVWEEERYRISRQICEGLAYLHSQGIVHGDLKGHNVLVSTNGVPMITDFGNAVLRDQTLKFTGKVSEVVFSNRWAAPEILDGSGTFSTAADVYALGMTILETVTGNVPFAGIMNQAIYTMVIINKAIPARPYEVIPSSTPWGDRLWELLTSCWLREPGDRPSAKDASEVMKAVEDLRAIHK